MLILKPFLVKPEGFQGYTYYARSRGQALSRAWNAYCCYRAISFKEFLRIAKCEPGQSRDRFGERITVQGRPAYWVDCNRQYIQFAYPDSDQILNSHPYDVEPPEARRGTPYYDPSKGTEHGD